MTSMYHISDLKKFNRCPRLFLQSQQDEKMPFYSYIRMDEAVSDLAARKLGVEKPFVGTLGDDPSLALEALKDHDWLMKARFEYGGLRIKVPFMHRNGDAWELYFLFTGLYPHNNDMELYCDTVWVLEQNGIQLSDVMIVHLNEAYVREDELDIDQLFIVSRSLYNFNNNPTIPFFDEIRKQMKDPQETIRKMSECTAETLSEPVRTNKCAGRLKCRYYDSCFPNEAEAEDDSIMTLIAAKHRYQMEQEGLLYLRDADVERIEGSPQQYAQILADRCGGLFADKMALQAWLEGTVYPVSFLDFEWERYAVPPYKGMKPYQVLPFEYSLHILHADGTVDHKVFLSVHDDRRELTESLIRDVPEQGTIIAYNAEGAEKIRISEMAEQFPEYADTLLEMNARMKDLQIPFISGMIYDVRMRGSWTLKQIMSMMEDPGYSQLEIRQGMDAVFQWRQLDRDEDVNKDEIIDDLKKYCGMDSWAMVVVYKWIRECAGL